MDNLTSLLKAYGGASLNEEVKTRILELIQAWAAGAETRPNAGYITEVYTSLQREGFHFPPKEQIASSMYESNAVSDRSDLEEGKPADEDLSSRQSGQTQMFVCAAVRSSPSPIVSTTVATAEMYFAAPAQANQSLFLIWGSLNP